MIRLPSSLALLGCLASGSACDVARLLEPDDRDKGSETSRPYSVGSCAFADRSVAESVRSSIPSGNVSDVLDVESLSLGADVRSLAGLDCLENLAELHLFGAGGDHVLDLAHLVELESLRVLHLTAARFDRVEVVAALPLTHLHLAGLDWTGFDALAGSNVEVMWIREMPATDLSALATFSKLRSLSIETTETRDLTPLGDAPALQDLSLTRAPIEELDGLGRSPHLRLLLLSATNVKDLTGLAGAAELSQLQLDEAIGLTSLAGLESSMSLRQLWIGRSSVKDLSPLRGLPALEVLRLDGGAVSELGPLADCPGLVDLALTRHHVVDLEPLAALPLRSLVIGQNEVVSLEPLRGLDLESLDVSNNPIGSLAPLADLPGLISLRMDDVGATSLAALAGLELGALRAAGNEIVDVGPLVGMPLGTLDLRDNSIASLPDDFVGAEGSCSNTWLDGNPLDADADSLLEDLCATASETGRNIVWDGGACVNCVLLR